MTNLVHSGAPKEIIDQVDIKYPVIPSECAHIIPESTFINVTNNPYKVCGLTFTYCNKQLMPICPA